MCWQLAATWAAPSQRAAEAIRRRWKAALVGVAAISGGGLDSEGSGIEARVSDSGGPAIFMAAPEPAETEPGRVAQLVAAVEADDTFADLQEEVTAVLGEMLASCS